MDDKYYLRKSNIDELDLSKYEKDYSQEELSAVKQALLDQQKQHQESFDKLPFTDRAKYYASDAAEVIEQNPESFLAVPAAAALFGAGKALMPSEAKSGEKPRQVFGSLRDMMTAKKEEGLLASQQADKVIQQANMSAKEVASMQTPTSGVDTSTDIGKGLSTNDQGLVGKSKKNKEAATVAKEVGASDVRKFTRDAQGNIQWPEKTSASARAGAEAFMQQYPDLAKQLEARGEFAILGAGSGDNSLYNTYGAQTRKDIIQQVNQGKLAGTHGGNEGFYNKKLTPAIAAVPPDTALGAELERLRAVEPKGGNYGQLGTSVAVKKGSLVKGKNQLPGAFKAGAPAALLLAISNAANARDLANSAGEAILPLGATPSPVQSGKIPALENKERAEQFILNQPGNRAELESMTKGKSPKEANKIREEYLASAATSDFDRASRLFRQQANAQMGIAPPR
jgi:hypothetical protein